MCHSIFGYDAWHWSRGLPPRPPVAPIFSLSAGPMGLCARVVKGVKLGRLFTNAGFALPAVIKPPSQPEPSFRTPGSPCGGGFGRSGTSQQSGASAWGLQRVLGLGH